MKRKSKRVFIKCRVRTCIKSCVSKFSVCQVHRDELYAQNLVMPKYVRSFDGKYHNAVLNAKYRGLDWGITKEQYLELMNQKCFYCDSFLNPTGSGLDRIYNDLGYLPINVKPCCGDCNKARGDRYTMLEFKVMVEALLKFRRER